MSETLDALAEIITPAFHGGFPREATRAIKPPSLLRYHRQRLIDMSRQIDTSSTAFKSMCAASEEKRPTMVPFAERSERKSRDGGVASSSSS